MKSFNRDVILSIAVLFQMVISVVQLILPLTGMMSVEQAAKLRVMATLITFIPAILSLLQHDKRGLILSFGTYFFVILLGLGFYPNSAVFINSSQAWTLTPIVIITFLCMYNIKDYDKFWRLLLYSGRLCTGLAVVYLVMYIISPLRDTSTSYNMHFGYSLLLPIMYLFTSSRLIDKLLSMVMLGIVLLVGSRGPALLALFFYAIYAACIDRKLVLKLAVPLLILAPIVVADLPKYFDMDSARTISLILSGEVGSHDSGRTDIYNIVESKIFERPITGWGIGSDRAFLHTYAHNLMLELALHYGVIISALILFAIFFYFIGGLKHNRARRVGGWIFIIMMALYGLAPLMVSSSYLEDYKFATFMGVLLSAYRKGYHIVANLVQTSRK